MQNDTGKMAISYGMMNPKETFTPAVCPDANPGDVSAGFDLFEQSCNPSVSELLTLLHSCLYDRLALRWQSIDACGCL